MKKGRGSGTWPLQHALYVACFDVCPCLPSHHYVPPAPCNASRGFITLSASLGQMLVALHRALLHSVQSEHDPLVLSATLRALGTLLLGAPYHRLPPQLLPLCVQALLGCLAKASPPQPAGVAALAPEQLPVVSACLSCLAAAFSSKAAGSSLLQNPGPAAGGTNGSGGQQEQLLQLLFSYAGCQHAALQLEAVMALRGVAQQHVALLDDHWEQLLAIARAGAALPACPQPSRPQGGEGCCRLPCHACEDTYTPGAPVNNCSAPSLAAYFLQICCLLCRASRWQASRETGAAERAACWRPPGSPCSSSCSSRRW